MRLAFDLFAGAGGSSTGLRAAGYDVIGFELDRQAAASHAANGHTTVACDLNTWPWRGSCDLLWASPPCTPFSAAGLHHGHKDARDGMPAFLRAVAALSPPVVVMENVKGLTHKTHRWYLNEAVAVLQYDYGYDVEWKVLNCADFGVPQTRQRLILIARNDGVPIVWPTPTHAKIPGLLGEQSWISMAEALGWDSMSMRVGFPRRGDNKGAVTADGYRERDTRPIDEPAQHVTEKARSWMVFDGDKLVLNTGLDMKKGEGRATAHKVNVSDNPAPTVSPKSGQQWYVERPATTVQADNRIWPPGHKTNNNDPPGKYQKRASENVLRITPEQAACLQGFPEGYIFTGTRTNQFRQIGNAAPPPLVEAVIRRLSEQT